MHFNETLELISNLYITIFGLSILYKWIVLNDKKEYIEKPLAKKIAVKEKKEEIVENSNQILLKETLKEEIKTNKTIITKKSIPNRPIVIDWDTLVK